MPVTTATQTREIHQPVKSFDWDVPCLFVSSPNSWWRTCQNILIVLWCMAFRQMQIKKILVNALCFFFPVTKNLLTPWSLCMRWQKLVRRKLLAVAGHSNIAVVFSLLQFACLLFLEPQCKSMSSVHLNTIGLEVEIEPFYSHWGFGMPRAK